MRKCWGIYRELAHSPGRETDDAAILEATAARLRMDGFEVTLVTPEETDAVAEPPEFVFGMCERPAILELLADWERRGTVVINPTAGIWNTYRDRTLARFEANGVPFPASILVPTAPDSAEPPSFVSACWVKRGDVHATAEGDVSFASNERELTEALARLRSRGIGRALVQQHAAGDLVKFYGVGREADSGWFRWFYHRGQAVAKHPFAPEALASSAYAAASALELEVFGGDAIVGADGSILVIDLNAWPSFALFRDEASGQIASHLASRYRQEAGVLS